MSVKRWMSVASIAAGLTAVAILAVMVPRDLWTIDCLVAALLIFLSFSAPAITPVPKPRGTSTDASAIWLIGPLGSLHFAILLIGGVSLWFGLTGMHTAAWATSVLWCGVVVVGWSILNASTKIVDEAANQTSAASDDARAKWSATLRRLSVQTDQEPVRRILDDLAERVRYAANDRANHPAIENQAITELIGQVERAAGQQDELAKVARSAITLLEQREQSIRATRSRA